MSYYDVVIVGAGPVGLVEAGLLRALDKNLKICILEGREQATRDFGIAIGSDSVKTVTDVINRALANPQRGQRDDGLLKELKDYLNGWSRFPSVRTNQIQAALSEKLHRVGIEILKGKDYKISEERLSSLFDPRASSELLSPQLQALKASLSHAKIIIGADGAHSTIRKTVMGKDEANLVDVETYGYALEVKYEIATNSNKRPTLIQHKFSAGEVGEILVETIGKANPGTNLLPVTDLLLLVDENVHQGFIEKNEKNETVKGSPGNGWSLEELETRAKTNHIVKKYLKKIQAQINRTKEICQAHENVQTKPPQVTTIPLTLYRSREIVKVFQDKLVLLVGDASSGLILKRGFNKGLMEAAFSAEAIVKYMERVNGQRSENPKELPTEFNYYQEQAQKTFAREKWWIRQKTRFMAIVKFPLKYFIHPIYRFFSDFIRFILQIKKKKRDSILLAERSLKPV
jgi:2-polyprenyl-6-methoxyphenol hydroxylase-like FAD-dependent oxidoreductase